MSITSGHSVGDSVLKLKKKKFVLTKGADGSGHVISHRESYDVLCNTKTSF